MSDDAQTIICWIRDNCPRIAGHPLTVDTPLLDNGGMDSLDIMELIMALESMYGVVLDTEQVTQENFGSVNQIVAMMHRVRRAAA